MIKPVAVELSGYRKSQLSIETLRACIALNNLEPKVVGTGVSRRLDRRLSQTGRQSPTSVANPGSAADQIPFGATLCDIPKA